MKWFVLLGALAWGQSAVAMEADEAMTFLVGSWSSPVGQTYIFTADGSWEQYSGGKFYESSFSTEPMPANMFAIVSSTGKRYVVHTAGETFRLFLDGSSELLGTYFRVVD